MSLPRLRWLLVGLWLLLVLPLLLLLVQTERQIQWEAFHQYRALAEDLAQRIDTELQAEVRAEDARSAADYQYLSIGGDTQAARLLQRSPLAGFPPSLGPAGVLGHFQVNSDGSLSTPLLPPAAVDGQTYGLAVDELRARGLRSRELLDILSRNELLAPLPAAAASPRAEAAEADVPAQAAEPDVALEVPRTQEAQTGGPVPPSTHDGAGGPTVGLASADRSALPEGAEAASDEDAGRRARNAPEDYLANQRGFDELQAKDANASISKQRDLGRLDELALRQNRADEAKRSAPRRIEPGAKQDKAEISSVPSERASRKEKLLDFGEGQLLDDALASLSDQRVRMFEGEIDPFEFSLLGSGHGVLYRKVWREGRRLIQGLLFEQAVWLQASFAEPFRASPLAEMSDLLLVYRGVVLQAVHGRQGRDYRSAAELQGEVLLQSRLSAPYADLQLVWTINRLPAGPGARAVRWTGGSLLLVMSLVFGLLYRLGRRQIELACQQQDFVSAVSHELKTPLTSIRMYGELLLQGWASEEKKREYYGFIHDESERLSRLIGNVLQLARMERNELELRLETRSVGNLIDLARSKLSAQVERAGFALHIEIDPKNEALQVRVDADAWLQILINLVDNALKFSRHAARRQVDLSVLRQADHVCLRVRDYGPGIPRDQLQKIFRLFYRIGSELTRETVGTGIGLALARQLAQAMEGALEVRNREPGAEFELRLAVVASDTESSIAEPAQSRDGDTPPS